MSCLTGFELGKLPPKKPRQNPNGGARVHTCVHCDLSDVATYISDSLRGVSFCFLFHNGS